MFSPVSEFLFRGHLRTSAVQFKSKVDKADLRTQKEKQSPEKDAILPVADDAALGALECSAVPHQHAVVGVAHNLGAGQHEGRVACTPLTMGSL